MKMSLTKQLSICAIVLMASCTTYKASEVSHLNIPQEVFYSCPNISLSKSSLDIDLLDQSKETFKMYQECRKWNEQKNIILKRLLEK